MRSWSGLVAGLSLAFAQVASGQAVVPVADAGPDVALVCAAPAGTPLNLNGTGSSIGPDFTYLWSAPGVQFSDTTSLTPIAIFPPGTTEVTLVVTYTDPVTGDETQASDTVLVMVTDSSPPLLYADATPEVLWPPNHRLVPIDVDVIAFDSCDGTPDVELVFIDSSEAENGTGDGNTDADIQNASVGTDDRDFLLRAERSGPGAGRIYTALYRATDDSGNFSEALVRVLVPHDRGHGDVLADDDSGVDRKELKQAQKAAKKAAKQQMKAAKKAAKAAKKAYKVALRAAE